MSRYSLVREDPAPVRRRRSYDWEAVAARAKADPGSWYKVFDEDKQSLVVAIRGGRIADLHPDHGFTTTTRYNHQNSEGVRVCQLFVKYVPENKGGEG